MTLNGLGNNMKNQSMNNNHHWLNGLEMYIDRFNPAARDVFHDIKEIILRGDIYKIRNALIREISRGYTDNSEEFVNTILNAYLPHSDSISTRRAVKYIAHSIDDEYIRRIAVSALEFESKLNLSDHFSRGQMMSKFWMIDELKKINQTYNKVLHYGGWYATIYQLLQREFNIQTYRNIEIDKIAAGVSDNFNYKELYDNWKFKSVLSDVNDLYWKDGSVHYSIRTHDKKLVNEIINPDLIINTSCEHMNETWFHNLPSGMLVCLQTNDYFSNEQHINSVHNEDEAVAKYPMSKVLFKGTLNTPVYNRFMLIGRK